MFPHVHFEIFGWSVSWATNTVLLAVTMVLGLTSAFLTLRKYAALWKIITLVLACGIMSVAGARLFHVFFERPELLNTPHLIFTQFDGMTFYGSMLLGVPTFALLVWLMIPKSMHARIWGVGTIIMAASYGILRVGCFAQGCCWGDICPYPWAVKYFSDQSAMPALGIPVHPVQLYDAFVGFSLAGILWFLYRKKPEWRGLLFWMFCVGYALGRFVTEEFRGDTYRGVDLIWGLSTSQLISVALIMMGVVGLAKAFASDFFRGVAHEQAL